MPEPVSDTTLRDQIAEALYEVTPVYYGGGSEEKVPWEYGKQYSARIFDSADAVVALWVERDRKVKAEAWDEGVVFAAPGRDFRYGNPYRIETKEEQK